MKPIIRLALLAATAAAVACADDASPTAAVDLLSKQGIDSTKHGSYAIRGLVLRYSGAGDSASDTLGTLVPVAAALVEAWRIGDAFPDSMPHDTVPKDTVPHDSVPGDTMLWAARGAVQGGVYGNAVTTRPRFASAADTTVHGDSGIGGGIGGGSDRPVLASVAHTDAQGAFSLERLPSGTYRIDVTPRGSAWVYAWTVVVVRDADVDGVRFTLPPER